MNNVVNCPICNSALTVEFKEMDFITKGKNISCNDCGNVLWVSINDSLAGQIIKAELPFVPLVVPGS